MTRILGFIAAFFLCFEFISFAQMPGAGASPGPRFDAAMAKLFGENSAFSATVENQIKLGGETTIVPGKIAFDSGKSRFEMNMADMKGGGMPPDAAEQMKQFGLDRMIAISIPAKNVNLVIYPGLNAYAPMPIPNQNGAASESEYKVETTELGKETVDGHPCVKNKMVVTDGKGNQHEATVWNATDLKNFPVKIETTQEGQMVTMRFKEIKLAKPDAALFEPPSNFKKYDSVMALMQQEMMKRMGGGMGF